MFAVDDQGGAGEGAGRLGVGVLGSVENPVLMTLKGVGALFVAVAPRGLDLDELGMSGDLAVYVRGNLRTVAIPIKALVREHVRKKCGVVSAAAGAGGASSGGGVESRVFAVERRIGKGEIEIVLYPSGEELGG